MRIITTNKQKDNLTKVFWGYLIDGMKVYS